MNTSHIFRTFAAASALLVGATFSATAEDVTLSHKGLTLSANLNLADGKALGDGIVLITHGTLAHNKMEIIVALQELLKERELSSLAIQLSFSQDNRRGNFDCKTDIRHKHTDAVDEIALWVDWLKSKGVGDIVLSGHSRGGNQTAWFMAERDDDKIKGAALIAPSVWSYDESKTAYKSRYKVDLEPLLGKMQGLIKAGKGDSIVKGVNVIYCADASVTPDSFISYYDNNPLRNSPTALKKVKKPVLVISGSEDTVVKGLPKAIGKMGADNISVADVDGADHFFQDLYGEDVADLIAEFIETLK